MVKVPIKQWKTQIKGTDKVYDVVQMLQQSINSIRRKCPKIMDEKGYLYFPYHKKIEGMDVKGKNGVS